LSVPHHRTFLPPFPLPLPLLSHAVEPPSKGRPCGHTRRRGWHQRVPKRNPPSTSTTTTYIEGSAQSLANRGLSSPFPLSVTSGGGGSRGEGGGELSEGALSAAKTGAAREEKPDRRRRAHLHPLLPLLCVIVFFRVNDPTLPLFPNTYTSARGHRGEGMFTRSSVEVPTFEPRGEHHVHRCRRRRRARRCVRPVFAPCWENSCRCR
jgi:hypothetical protein